MANNYLSDAESLADLEARIDPLDLPTYHAFRHLRVEAAFIGRIYVIYTPEGLHPDRTHRPPKLLGQIRVLRFACDAGYGATLTIEDMLTGALQEVGYVPQRCFHYDFFIGIPPYSRIRWDGRREDNGAISRSMTFGVLFKTRSRADYYSAGCVCAETPNNFRRLYPNVPLNLLYA